MTNPLSLQPLPLDQLPTSANDPRYEPLLKSLLASASTLIASLPSKSASWRPRKVYNTPDHPTATYSSPSPPGPASLPSGISWHARVSSHAGARYEDFRDGLLVDHTVHEQEYVHSCVEAERLQVIKEGVLEVWRTAYNLPFPTANRDFTFLILTVETNPGSSTPVDHEADDSPIAVGSRSFTVISVPVEAPHRPGWLRAAYCSVERVLETPRELDWSMATASTVNGKIPNFIAEMAMPGKIAEDVPFFLGWLEKRASR